MKKRPPDKGCYISRVVGDEKIRDFSMNEFRIDFDTDQIVFHVEFGLPGACMSVGGTSVALKLEEVEPYLNK